MYADPSGHFLISTAVALGGIFAYNLAKENGAEGFSLFGFTMLGIILGGVSDAIIGATVGSIIGYGIGLLWSTAPIAGSNGSIALWSGGNGAAAKAVTDFATKTGAKIVSQTFAGKTLSFASHFIPKTLSNYFWGNLSAEFVAGAASATIYLYNPGIATKSVFYTYEIWVLLEQGIERTIYYV